MSRPRPAEGPTVSLFPFLAVLLCTMGSLLVLLVLFSRSAREKDDGAAAAAAAAAARQRQDELAALRDDLSWRLEQLQTLREGTAADLARERLRLAGAEDDARRLADELADLERVAAALAVDATVDRSGSGDAAVAARLASAKEALDKARKDAASKPPAYAVVPYEGAHGTHRRPLYIECALNGVYLQPEGIRLGPADFEGPPGPGNPLASGLRAAREHLAAQTGDAGDPAAQPYPLLLVRPSGVMAYYAARESIQSWGSEFGYQFIDEDWTLQFPPADPLLAQAEQRAIDESRRRLAWLGDVRRQRPARPTQQFRAATTRGGVIAAGGPSVLGDRSRFDWTEGQAAQAGGGEAGRGFSPGDRSEAAGADVLAATGAGADGLGGTSGSGAAGGSGNRGEGRGGRGTGSAGGGPAGPGPGGTYAGPSRFYTGASAAAATNPAAGEAATAASGGAETEQGASASQGGDRRDEGAAAGGSLATAATGSGTGRFGSATAGGGQSSQGDAGTGGGGGMQGPAGLGASSGSTQASAGGASGGSVSMSLAGQRGSNWASLATAERPVPLRRPIRVACTAQELRLLDDGGRRVETRIPCPGATVFAVDPLVTAIHAKVAGWGIAGDRMYWKPELILSVSAGGEGRRDELERLLADSGLDTRRAESSGRVERLPPVDRTGAVGIQR